MRARIFLSLTAPSTLRQNGSAKISGSPKTEYTSRYAPRYLREANCSLDARRSQPGGGRKPADRKASTTAPFRAAAGAPNFHVMANGGYSSASSASESEKDSDTESEDDVEPLSVVTYLDPAEKDSDSESEDDSLLMAVRSLLRTLSKKALMDIVAASRTEEAMPKTLTKEELAEFILQYGSFNVARREYGDQDKYLDALRNDLKLYNEIAREELRRINALRKVCYEQRRAEAVKLIDKAALMEMSKRTWEAARWGSSSKSQRSLKRRQLQLSRRRSSAWTAPYRRQ